MVEPIDVDGKRVAMIAWGVTSEGLDDVAVFTGIGRWNGESLTLVREPIEASFVVPTEWLSRLKPVPAALKETLLGSDYRFSVSVGNLSEGVDLSAYLRTGLKWPSGGKT